jgi:hypothetical protein
MHIARLTISAQTLSAAGDALQTFPPTVPRPWI